MNCTQAKSIKISDILDIAPVYQKNGSRWYISPFREEKTPSFQVNEEKNIWFDHGSGAGGNILDLVCEMNKCGLQQALQILSGSGVKVQFNKSEAKQVIEKNKIELLRVLPLNIIQIEYARSRGVDSQLTAKYCKTVHYRNNGKSFYSLGFTNDLGGWELRGENFKAAIAPKAYTFIKGESAERCNVFEGFLNFLSLLEIQNRLTTKFDTVILNSLSMLETFNFSGYKKLNSFLDNDNSGEKALLKLQQKNEVVNCSKNLYPDFKDLNEFLIKSKI